jgi:hypothetical protein
MPVAHQALAAIVRSEMSMGRESFGNLGFHRLRQQSAPLRSASVSGSAMSRGWRKAMTLSPSMAYQPLNGCVIGSHRH